MKKAISIMLAFILVFSLAACGGGGTPSASPSGSPAPQQVNLSMVTGGESGTYYAFGGMISTVLSDAIENVSITASTSGASAANVRSINKGDADLAILQNDVFDYAYRGVESFVDDGALTNVATIGTLYPEVIQLVATEDSGIQSVADLAGKRVSVGDLGSGVEANARQILEAYGLTYEDLGKVEHLGFADSSTAIQQQTIDAAFVTAGVPNPAIQELNAVVKVRLIPIDGDEAAALIEAYPFYAPFVIEDGTYDGMDGVVTVSVLATLACSADLDEDTVYSLTKALFENKENIAHAKAEDLDAEKAVTGVTVPFHPGAIKYYTEIGVM